MDCNPFRAGKPDMRQLFIFGAGGFGCEVAWLAEQCWGSAVSLRFLVDKPAYLQPEVNGVQTVLLSQIKPEATDRYVAALGDPVARRRVSADCDAVGLIATTIVHPRAECSRWISIQAGSIVCAGVIATTNIHIGRHVHVNLDCTIGHDVVIGDFATLSPGVHVSGRVTVGEGVFIGTGATIINGQAGQPLVIGDGAVIAAGACVTKPVEPGALVAGVPAVRKR